MIFFLPILISLMSTAVIEAFSNNNSNSNINNNLNSQLTRRRSLSCSLPQQVRRSCSSSSALSAHHGFRTNHHDSPSLVSTSSFVRSSLVPVLNGIRTHSNNNGYIHINGNGNGRRRRSSNTNRCGPLFLSPVDLVAFSSAISAKIQAKKGAAGLIQKVAGKAAIASASVAAVDTAAAASTATTSAAMITTAAAAATATDTASVATAAAAAATTSVSESAHQLVVATATAIASPDKQAEVLSDSSFALCEYPTFLPDLKTNKLRIRVAQVLGRILIIDISLLPGHTFHPEELAIQLFLLGASLQPIIRSFKLLRKIKEVQCNKDGCIIDFDDLDDDEEFGDVESTNAVVDGEGHGRLKYSFGDDTSTDGGGDDANGSGGVSVQCTSEGCTIDFADDIDDVTAESTVVITDDDSEMMSGSIFECTLTDGEDGGFECTAITDTTDDPIISENQHATTNDDPHHEQHPDPDHNLLTSSFDDIPVQNIGSIRATAPQVMVVE